MRKYTKFIFISINLVLILFFKINNNNKNITKMKNLKNTFMALLLVSAFVPMNINSANAFDCGTRSFANLEDGSDPYSITIRTGSSNTCLGQGSATAGWDGRSTAIGASSYAEGIDSTAVGYDSYAWASATAVGSNAIAYGASSTAIGKDAYAEGYRSTAIGKDSYAQDAYSTALGARSSAEARNSVALGYGSISTRENTVSVGSIGNERQITNVAAGTQGTDAVNVNQLSKVQNKVTAGVAMAMAMGGGANIPQGKSNALSMAVGAFDDKQAVAASYSTVINPSTQLNASVGYGMGSESQLGARVGATFSW
jgi:hypothetical protein